MFKTFIKGNFLMIFAIFFAIPVIVLAALTFSNNTDYDYLLENGIEAKGYIIENSAQSTTSVNDVSYYSIGYYFRDENLNEHEGRTSESYTYWEITHMEINGSIYIKYDPETYESIEATYNPSEDVGRNTMWIFFAVFGLVDAIMWVIVIKVGRHNLLLAKVEKEGKEYTANVTGISSNVTINNVPRFKVHYTWIGDSGTTMSGSSTSKYFRGEAEALEMAKTITIKAMGKDSVIMTTPDMCLHNHYNNIEDGVANDLPPQTPPTPQKPQEVKCDYCGHYVSSSEKYCNNCGAQLNIYE